MTHTIKIPEYELKKLILKALNNYDAKSIRFEVCEGQHENPIVWAIITVEEGI